MSDHTNTAENEHMTFPALSSEGLIGFVFLCIFDGLFGAFLRHLCSQFFKSLFLLSSVKGLIYASVKFVRCQWLIGQEGTSSVDSSNWS